eukprot:3242117-Prymnesium_polylepis.1
MRVVVRGAAHVIIGRGLRHEFLLGQVSLRLVVLHRLAVYTRLRSALRHVDAHDGAAHASAAMAHLRAISSSTPRANHRAIALRSALRSALRLALRRALRLALRRTLRRALICRASSRGQAKQLRRPSTQLQQRERPTTADAVSWQQQHWPPSRRQRGRPRPHLHSLWLGRSLGGSRAG